MAKRVIFELNEVASAVAEMAKIVGSTLGPNGRNILIQSSFGDPRSTKDGVTVAKALEPKNKVCKLAVDFVRMAPNRTVKDSGDGTTTCTLLTADIFARGYRAISGGCHAADIKRGAETAVDALVHWLKKTSVTVGNDFQKIKHVAHVSSNGDEEIAEMIAKAMEKVGNRGLITVEEARSRETELDVVDGMQFDRGYLSPYFATDNEKMLCVLEDPYILLLEKKISSVQSLVPLLETVVREGRPLLIVAEDVESEVLATLVVNKLRGGLKIVAVKSPGFGANRKSMMEDMAILTGGQFISEDIGMKLEKVTTQDLGRAKRVIVDKDSTAIIGGGHHHPDAKLSLLNRCAQIERQIVEVTSEYDREKLQERLARLSGGVAVIRVGATTESEMKARKDLVDDAVQAAKAAAEEGIVAGGGSALIHAREALAHLKGDNHDQQIGIDLIRQAICKPLLTIVENAGESGDVVLDRIAHHKGSEGSRYGYNILTRSYGDMLEMGIIDPTKVVRCALQNAASVACLLLSSGGMIVEEQEKDAGPVAPGGHGGMGGMGDMGF